jgi:xanthine dehydrogenase YagS FAD-binding subunit
MTMNRFEWMQPETVASLFSSLGGGTIKAGGVDLLDRMKEGIDRPARLVDLGKLGELEGVTLNSSSLVIRPLTRLAKLAENAEVIARFPAIAEAARKIATPQIRNMATAGGNLLQRPRCWYFRNEQFHCLKKGGEKCFAQDGENQYHAVIENQPCAIVHPSTLATPLVAYDASVRLRKGERERVVALIDFFTLPSEDVTRENVLQPGELLVAIEVPRGARPLRSTYVKVEEKQSFDWPVAEVAVVLDMDTDRCRSAAIALGAAAPAPLRAKAAERELEGEVIDEAVARRAAKAAMKEATPLGENGYKIPLFEVTIRRAILAAANGVRA